MAGRIQADPFLILTSMRDVNRPGTAAASAAPATIVLNSEVLPSA
jgi:hypothetical protein